MGQTTFSSLLDSQLATIKSWSVPYSLLFSILYSLFYVLALLAAGDERMKKLLTQLDRASDL